MWLIHKPERDVPLTEKNPNIQHCKTNHWNFASPIYCVLLIYTYFPLSWNYLVVSDLDVWSLDRRGDGLGLYQWYRVGGHSQWSRRREPLFGLKKKTQPLYDYTKVKCNRKIHRCGVNMFGVSPNWTTNQVSLCQTENGKRRGVIALSHLAINMTEGFCFVKIPSRSQIFFARMKHLNSTEEPQCP